jgi:hypothetical protein
MDVFLPAQVRRRTDALVVEYSKAIPPGRVFTVAVMTARAMVRTERANPYFLERWEKHVRRLLTDQLAHSADLAAPPR